jgi:K(+)-stimulated pyrophosphate-energized sodium pump
MDLFLCGVGLVVTGLIVVITEYYTGTEVPSGALDCQASVTGHGTNVIQGLAVSLESTALPAIVIIAASLPPISFAGLFGIAIAVTTMLALAGMIVALDAFGPVTDNAGGIAEMAGLPSEVRAPPQTRSTLSATRPRPSPRATPSGLPVSVRWCCLRPIRGPEILLGQCRGRARSSQGRDGRFLDLSNPYVVVGLLFGGLLPYLFGGIAMTAVGRAGVVRWWRKSAASSRKSRAS